MEPIWSRREDSEPEHSREILQLFGTEESHKATNLWAEFQSRGWEPPDEAILTDEALPSALRRLIYDLSWLHVYLVETDHLSDRELYHEVTAMMRHDDMFVWPEAPESAISVSFMGCGRGPDMITYLRFYADEQERSYWRANAPELLMPEHEEPPFRRNWIPRRP